MRVAIPLVVSSLWLGACGDSLAPASEIATLRVLAVRADPPFAPPGSTAQLEMELWDGPRAPTAPESPTSILWLSTCVDPAGDRYDECYPELHRAAGQLSDDDLVQQRVPNGTSGVGFGTNHTLSIPADVILRRAPAPGIIHRYGLAYAFFVACRGELRHDPFADSARDAPVACHHPTTGARLGLEDTVFGYAPIYAYDEVRNDNPGIDGMTVEGDGSVPLCTNARVDDCPGVRVSVSLSSTSVERSVTAWTDAANAQPETLWISYFASAGKFVSDVVVVHDPTSGFAADYGGVYKTLAPSGTTARLWAVLHDTRNGVAVAHHDVMIR